MNTLEVSTRPEFQKIEAEGNELQARADSIEIVDDETRSLAANELKAISIRVTQVEALTESPWRSALNAYEEIQKWRKDLIARFTNPKKTIAAKIGSWDLKIEEKRRQEAAKAEEKARKEAQAKRDAEIAAAKAAKDKEAVKALKEAPLIVQPAAPKTQAPSKVSGVSTRFEWRLDVIFNPSALPREFLCPDEAVIKARIKSLGGNHGIPGVKAIQVPVTSGRA